jgi:hypothetical protein
MECATLQKGRKENERPLNSTVTMAKPHRTTPLSGRWPVTELQGGLLRSIFKKE